MILLSLFALASLIGRSVLSDEEALATEVDRIVARELAAGNVPGAVVAIVRDGKVVLARGYGVADLESKREVVADKTLFRVGSVSKIFTTLALTQAIDQGRIDYDDEVGPLLGDLEIDNPYDEPVRVWHLLTHTGGFDQIGTSRQVQDPLQRPPLGAFLEDQLRVIQVPGTVSCYDTYGITLAGYLLEQLSKRSYAEEVHERIFEPLGMTRTFVEVPDEVRADLAHGYGWQNGRHLPQPYEWYITLPASSIDSTATDIGVIEFFGRRWVAI